jgi:peptidyl-tRNA hydrolase, PTH1 family
MPALSVDIKLIAGLGNPGAKYSETRHNAGFWFVDALARQHGAVLASEKRFHGEVAKVDIGGNRIWLLKPATFMNRSGQSLRSLVEFYRLQPENVLVAHDEIDLEPGTVRLKSGGGHGGHNGLRDIIAQLGGRDFQRLRFGVGHPGYRDQVVDYVLHRPGMDEQQAIENSIDDALKVMPKIAAGEWEKAMHELHTR